MTQEQTEERQAIGKIFVDCDLRTDQRAISLIMALLTAARKDGAEAERKNMIEHLKNISGYQGVLTIGKIIEEFEHPKMSDLGVLLYHPTTDGEKDSTK